MVPDRSILVKPLEAIPEDGRDCLGIHQSDVILRTAIIAGIADLRANPDILDYVFASLPRDSLTFRDYGEKAVADAKNWFLNTDIPVMMNTRVDDSLLPCITVSVMSSTEDTATLGDVNYQPSEPVINKVVYYSPVFQVTSYDSVTGITEIPISTDEIFAGMVLLDNNGIRHVIIEAWEDAIVLEPGLNGDFSACQIASVYRARAALESLCFKEVFTVACHAPSEPVYLTYLHSILIFVLLRYKEELIEARGLERTTISSGEVYLNTSFAANIVFSRPTQVVGYVRQCWPKLIRPVIEGVL